MYMYIEVNLYFKCPTIGALIEYKTNVDSFIFKFPTIGALIAYKTNVDSFIHAYKIVRK